MANTGVIADLAKAKELRVLAKTVGDAVSRSKFEAAADRLEKRSAKKASKIGRKRPAK